MGSSDIIGTTQIHDPFIGAASTLEKIRADFDRGIATYIATLKRHSNWRRTVLRIPEEPLKEIFNMYIAETMESMASDFWIDEESYKFKLRLTHV